MTDSSAALPVHADRSTVPVTNAKVKNRTLLSVLRATWIILLAHQMFLLSILLVFSLTSSSDPSGTLYQLATYLSLLFTQFLLSFILFWRTGQDARAILFSFVLLTYPKIVTLPEGLLPPVLSRPDAFLNAVSFLAILYLFPDARFTRRWQGYWFGLITFMLFVNYLQFDLAEGIATYIFWPAFFVGVFSFIDRYRYATAVQRQQIKWLLPVFIALMFLIAILLLLAENVIPGSNSIGVGIFLYTATWFVLFAMMLAIALAVLRYRLYEVDLIINRSLVYGVVTLVLLAVGISILALISAVTGGRDVIGVAFGAGAAIGLYHPLRQRVQRFVDYRLYGLRYDLNKLAAAQRKQEIKNPGIYTGRNFGRYEVLGVLGQGGMGEVYQGTDGSQIVALKVLTQSVMQDVEVRKRFHREIDILSKLDHPNIVKLLDSGVTEDGVHYLAMEYIDGVELGDVIKRGPVTDFESLNIWISTIAAALDYIHQRGLVHRDVKPSNIMLRKSADGETYHAILMDFGIARMEIAGTRLTSSGAIGTINYMAPEQIMAAREVDGRADLYALGIVVYELVTGERPFKGGSAQVLFGHIQQPAPDPRNIRPDLARSTAKAILRALEKQPEARFASTGEFAAALAVTASAE
jgi:hypothetical protein